MGLRSGLDIHENRQMRELRTQKGAKIKLCVYLLSLIFCPNKRRERQALDIECILKRYHAVNNFNFK